nr:MAG TPA: P-loop Nucleotide Kinase1 [Caudoviricetes sp.]
MGEVHIITGCPGNGNSSFGSCLRVSSLCSSSAP